jgi:hypothetical protein
LGSVTSIPYSTICDDKGNLITGTDLGKVLAQIPGLSGILGTVNGTKASGK